MRRAARRDAIEPEVIDALKALGATFEQLDLEDGPDLLIGFRGVNHLVELRSGLRGRLSEEQKQWHERWRGSSAVRRSVVEVLRLIGAEPTPELLDTPARRAALRALLPPRVRGKLNSGRLRPSVRRG